MKKITVILTSVALILAVAFVLTNESTEREVLSDEKVITSTGHPSANYYGPSLEDEEIYKFFVEEEGGEVVIRSVHVDDINLDEDETPRFVTYRQSRGNQILDALFGEIEGKELTVHREY